ncbi:MAG TPA: DUF2169 domain-containing protein [Polyangiaceae bacterium]
MDVVHSTGLQVWTTAWQVRPPRYSLTVVVKATFTLDASGAPALAAEQDLPSGDVPWPEEPATPDQPPSLRYASDFAVFKPATDVLLVGHAYPTPASRVTLVELRVGDLRRRIAVFGDRSWGAEDRPAAFDKMPLRWERALGGPTSDANPVGRGYKTGLMLPNLERPESLVRSKGDTPAPACFAPIGPMSKSRVSKLGTYDASWLKTRWPYLPADFDWTYFNAAPPEQQVPYLRGDEPYSVSGVRPGGAAITGKLPGLRPRAFAQRTAAAGNEFGEVVLRLDTLWLDTDANKMVLVWRGLVDVADEDAPDVAALFVDVDPAQAPLSLERARERFVAQVASDQVLPADAVSFADEPPRGRGETPAAPSPPASAEVLAMLARGERFAGRDLTGVSLAGVDLSGADLKGALLARADLSGAKLGRAKLSGAVLTGVTAAGASFDGADLTQADLTGATLSNTSFKEADLGRAVLDHVDATGAHFVAARGDRASFVGAKLDRAKLDGASLLGADLSKATLEGATCRAAKLDDVRLYDARGAGVDFEGASLTNARAQKAALGGSSFLGVVAPGSSWEAADLTSCRMEKAKLDGAIFTRAQLAGANLSQASAIGAIFRRAGLKGARCLKTNLMQANFERADLTNADLRGANLFQAETWRAKTDGANLELAHVAGTKLAP